MVELEIPPLYSLRNITKTYVQKEGPVLEISALEIPRGKIVAMIGVSGSGKTTLLNILSMLESPDILSPHNPKVESSLRLVSFPGADQEELLRISAERRQKLRSTFGFVFQQGYLLENLTCGDNIQVPFHINKLNSSSAMVSEMLLTVDLEEAIIGRQPSDLSGGERQRISVLRALGHGPSIVFADEPTSSLDEKNAVVVMAGLSTWCKAQPNRTVLLVTHDTRYVSAYADSVILMAAGRVRGPIPIICKNGERMSATELSAKLAHFKEEVRSASDSPQMRDYLSVENPKAAIHPRANICRFIGSFALSDVFPRASGNQNESMMWRVFRKGFFQAVFRRRNAQFHSMASMFFAMVLALFFASLYSALSAHFDILLDDQRVARIEVLGHRDGESLLTKKDVDELSNLSWAKGPMFNGVTTLEEIKNKNLTKISPAVKTAVGYRIREMRFVKNITDADLGFSTTTALPVLSAQASDPILQKIVMMEGTQVANMVPGKISVDSKLSESADAQIGAICTKAGLLQMGFKDAVPKTIALYPPYAADSAESVPLLAVVEWLPKSAELLITEDMYRKFFFVGGSGDPLPRFESVVLYLDDMRRDGIALYEGLQRLGYSVSADKLALLRWVIGLTRAIRYFSLAAAIGVFLVVAVTLIVSYSEGIRRKEKQIGVLLAYGAPMTLLYAVFLTEVGLVWLVAVLAAMPSHWFVAKAVENLVAQGFELRGAQRAAQILPWKLWFSILTGSLAIAVGSVWWTMRSRIDPERVAQTLRSPD
jgi:putative ABC transport system ATP-binding protein